MRISLSGTAAVIGDRLMLRRAISNLLSNALRHTPPQGQIEISIETLEGGKVCLSVRNAGRRFPRIS